MNEKVTTKSYAIYIPTYEIRYVYYILEIFGKTKRPPEKIYFSFYLDVAITIIVVVTVVVIDVVEIVVVVDCRRLFEDRNEIPRSLIR